MEITKLVSAVISLSEKQNTQLLLLHLETVMKVFLPGVSVLWLQKYWIYYQTTIMNISLFIPCLTTFFTANMTTSREIQNNELATQGEIRYPANQSTWMIGLVIENSWSNQWEHDVNSLSVPEFWLGFGFQLTTEAFPTQILKTIPFNCHVYLISNIFIVFTVCFY